MWSRLRLKMCFNYDLARFQTESTPPKACNDFTVISHCSFSIAQWESAGPSLNGQRCERFPLCCILRPPLSILHPTVFVSFNPCVLDVVLCFLYNAGSILAAGVRRDGLVQGWESECCGVGGIPSIGNKK